MSPVLPTLPLQSPPVWPNQHGRPAAVAGPVSTVGRPLLTWPKLDQRVGLTVQPRQPRQRRRQQQAVGPQGDKRQHVRAASEGPDHADGGVYVDLGPNYFDHRVRDKVQARLTRRLEALGFEVTVTERAAAVS